MARTKGSEVKWQMKQKVNGDSNKVVNEAKRQYSSLIDLARVMGKHVDYSAILIIKSKLNIPDEIEVFFTAQEVKLDKSQLTEPRTEDVKELLCCAFIDIDVDIEAEITLDVTATIGNKGI